MRSVTSTVYKLEGIAFRSPIHHSELLAPYTHMQSLHDMHMSFSLSSVKEAENYCITLSPPAVGVPPNCRAADFVLEETLGDLCLTEALCVDRSSYPCGGYVSEDAISRSTTAQPLDCEEDIYPEKHVSCEERRSVDVRGNVYIVDSDTQCTPWSTDIA